MIKGKLKNMEKVYNITLDGPSGSGKSTIAKALADKLGITYLDTGAMYRAVGYYMLENKIDVSKEEDVVPHLDEIDLVVKDEGKQEVILNGKDIAGSIRTPEISMAASTVSKIPAVRLKLVELQRKMASQYSMILDGRDIGSYVLPDAEYKFYLTADVEVRAKRRYLELKNKGEDVSLSQVKEQMIARDEQDSSRAFAPLCVPTGAYVIDTSNLGIDEVLDIVINKINR